VGFLIDWGCFETTPNRVLLCFFPVGRRLKHDEKLPYFTGIPNPIPWAMPPEWVKSNLDRDEILNSESISFYTN